MALNTFSKFYFGLTFDESICSIDFEEDSVEFNTAINPGSYTFQSLVDEISRVMNALGDNEYEVTIDRVTRAITISADGEFSLLSASGLNVSTSAFQSLGFDVTEDYTGASEYTSEPCGFEYVVQFPIQSYVSPMQNKKPRDSSVKRSTSGVTEAIVFGLDQRMETDLLFVTNVYQPPGGIVRNNPEGVEACARLLDYAITKAPVEFMVDESKAEEFEVFILEMTEADPNGLGYKLTEEYDKGLPEYFKTGKLTWLLQEQS